MIKLKEGYKNSEVGVIPVEWEEKKLKDVCNFYLGLTYTPKYVDSGVPFLSVKDITKGYLSFEKTRYIAREEFENSTSNAKPQRGDIIFGRVGTLGQPLIVETDIEFCIFVSLGLMRVFDNLHNVFLKQWMTSDYFKKQVDSKVIGSAQKNLNIGWLRNFKFPLPPLKEQEKIADILSTVDEKIDSITFQIQKAQTLKNGLLQKLLSEGIKHNKFKDSEIGKIPENWEVRKLEDILTIKYGKSQKNVEDTNGNYPILGTGGIMGYANNYLYDKPSVLIGRKGTIDKPQYMETPFWTVDTLFYTEIKENIYSKFVYYIFQTIPWKKYNEASGVPSLSKPNIHNITTILLPFEEQKQIADILSTVDEKIEILKTKKEKYQTLKKGLLQKLLSGEIRVI